MNAIRAAAASALSTAALCAAADTVWFDRDRNTPGVASNYGGEWSLAEHSASFHYWTTDGGVTWRDWTAADADSIAAFTSSFDLNMSVDNASGAVAAKGLWIDNDGVGKKTKFNGDALTIGSAGIIFNATSDGTVLILNCDTILSASQTWRSRNDSTMLKAGTMVQVYGAVSADAAASASLALDGAGLRPPVISQSTDQLCGFGFYGSVSEIAELVVTNGATFAPMYTATYPAAKIPSTASLVLAGGSISPRGTDCEGETFAATTLLCGENQVRGYNANGTAVALGALTRCVGATLDANNASYGGTSTTADTAAAPALAWASFARSGFACVSGGTFGQVGEKQRPVNNWGADGATYTRATSGGTVTAASRNPATLRVMTTEAIDLADCEVTIETGGLMFSSEGTMTGGALKSGAATGELVAHVFADYSLGSALSDNGETPMILVKSGSASLTLSGDTAYTGGTYLNAGRLAFKGAASLSGPVSQQATSTLAFEDGGALNLDAASPLVLHGDLAFGSGAVVKARLGGSFKSAGRALVTHDAPTGKAISLPGDGSAVALAVTDAKDDKLAKGDYPLIVAADADVAASLSADAFSLALPNGVAGSLVETDAGLVLRVTAVPSSGLRVILR